MERYTIDRLPDAWLRRAPALLMLGSLLLALASAGMDAEVTPLSLLLRSGTFILFLIGAASLLFASVRQHAPREASERTPFERT